VAIIQSLTETLLSRDLRRGNPEMFRTILAAAALSALSFAPAYADEMMKCDDASMMKVQAGVDEAMKDSSMKQQEDMAMQHMDLAKKSMAANKTDECAMHLDEAMKALKKK
jgi:hypothetical protein